MGQLHLDLIASLESVLHEHHLRCELIQTHANAVHLLDLSQQLQSDRTYLCLAKGTLDVCKHVQVARSLPQELSTTVVYAILSLVKVFEQDLRISLILQGLKLLLESLVHEKVCLWHVEPGN